MGGWYARFLSSLVENLLIFVRRRPPLDSLQECRHRASLRNPKRGIGRGGRRARRCWCRIRRRGIQHGMHQGGHRHLRGRAHQGRRGRQVSRLVRTRKGSKRAFFPPLPLGTRADSFRVRSAEESPFPDSRWLKTRSASSASSSRLFARRTAH